VEAKKLEKSIRKCGEPLYTFLQAARKDQLTFSIPALQLWKDLASVQRALDSVDNLLSGNADLDATKPDSVSEDADETHCIPRLWRQTVCRDVSADPAAMAAAQLGFPIQMHGSCHVDRPFLPVPPCHDTPWHTTAHLAQPSAFCPAHLLGIYVLPNGHASVNPDFRCSGM
jgi:hypothetical protein